MTGVRSAQVSDIHTSSPRPRNRKRQFAFNAAASWAVGLFKAVMQLALLPIMARLLDPTAFGIYALALPTVLFFVMLADGGLGLSLSREDEENIVVWSTAFWALLGTCTIMGLGVAGSGFVLAWVSGQPSLVGIMALLSLVLPLLAVTVLADARLIRRGTLLFHSGADLAGSIVGAGIALVLAYHGAGAWSLAAQYVAVFVIRAAILNYAAWSLPALVFELASLRGHVSTGGALLASRLGELLGKLGENAMFGHVFGTASLGSYTLANQVSRFACDAVSNPVIGAFYVHALHETDAVVAALHARLTRLVVMVLFPTMTIAAVLAPAAFPLVLGPKWAEVAPVFQAVAVPYSLAAAAWLSGQVLLKHGLVDRSAKAILVSGLIRIGLVGIGFLTSPVVVAWLVGGSYVFQALLMTLAVPHGLRAECRALAAGLLSPVVATAVAGCTTWIALQYVPHQLGFLVLTSMAGLMAYAGALLAFDGSAIMSDLRGVSQLVRRRSAT